MIECYEKHTDKKIHKQGERKNSLTIEQKTKINVWEILTSCTGSGKDLRRTWEEIWKESSFRKEKKRVSGMGIYR